MLTSETLASSVEVLAVEADDGFSIMSSQMSGENEAMQCESIVQQESGNTDAIVEAKGEEPIEPGTREKRFLDDVYSMVAAVLRHIHPFNAQWDVVAKVYNTAHFFAFTQEPLH